MSTYIRFIAVILISTAVVILTACGGGVNGDFANNQTAAQPVSNAKAPQQQMSSAKMAQQQALSVPQQPSAANITMLKNGCDPTNDNLPRTHTWSLDSTNNSGCFPLLSSLTYSDGNIAIPVSGNTIHYIQPSSSTISSSSNFRSITLPNTRASNTHGIDFTSINRTRGYDSVIYPTDRNGSPYPVTFEGWGMIKTMIAFGGSDLFGSHVIAPDPQWVTAAHTEGVKIYGTVFLGKASSYNELNNLYSSAMQLTALAKALHIDGWLINMEYPHLRANSTETSNELNFYNAIFNNTVSIEYLVYFSGRTTFPETQNFDKNNWKFINDDNIVNFGGRSESVRIDLALGLDAANFSGAPGQHIPNLASINDNTSYLLYLDEPIFRRTMEGYAYPVRAQSAMAVACQQFNGTQDGVWSGLKTVANIRVRSDAFANGFSAITVQQLQNAAANRICVNAGSNSNDPISMAEPEPGPVLKITDDNWKTVSLYTNSSSITSNNLPSGTLLQSCSPDTLNTSCYFDLRGLGLSDGGTGSISFEIRENVGFPDETAPNGSGGYIQTTQQQNALVVQTIPTVKWFNKIEGIARQGTAAGMVWQYLGYSASNGRLNYAMMNVPLTRKCNLLQGGTTTRCEISIPFYSGSRAEPPSNFSGLYSAERIISNNVNYFVLDYKSLAPVNLTSIAYVEELFTPVINNVNISAQNVRSQSTFFDLINPEMSQHLNNLSYAINNNYNGIMPYIRNNTFPGVYYINSGGYDLPVPLWSNTLLSWPNNPSGAYLHNQLDQRRPLNYGNFPAVDWVMNIFAGQW